MDIELRPKSFDVLRLLVENDNQIVSKDDLVKAVWPNVIVNDDALAQCIRDIRKALLDDGERYVRTVPRRGYLFAAPVAPVQPVQVGGTTSLPLPRLLLVTLMIGLFTAFVSLAGLGDARLLAEQLERENRLTIAVLPFTVLGEGSDEDWLVDAIAEDIMVAVSRFRDLTVIGRNSSFRYRGKAADPRSIGAELNADFLLQGTLRRNGDRLRITAQLVDSRNGASRWIERYDRELTDVFAIQDDVAEHVAAPLVVHAKEATVARVRREAPANLKAYELALRGRKAYRTFGRDGILEAKALAERAIALDPDHAVAWEVLAAALLQVYLGTSSEHRGNPATLREARAAAEKAASLDGNFATAQAMLAAVLLHAREHDLSLSAVDKAVRLNPNDAVTHGVRGNILAFIGRPEEAIAAWKKAEAIDPFLPALNLALTAVPYVMLGEFEQALGLTRSCAQRAPTLLACSLYLAIAASELGLHDEAQRARSQLLGINPSFTVERHLQMVPFRHEADALKLGSLMRRAGLPGRFTDAGSKSTGRAPPRP